ncbi:type III secretion system protein PrgF [Enterococcus cecorum]|nr:type III secretion system protein PrgF [Enterococcus cecorum]
MEPLQKVLIIIGAIITISCGVGLVYSIYKLKNALETEDPRDLNKAISAVVVNGVIIGVCAGMIAYVNGLLSNIQF